MSTTSEQYLKRQIERRDDQIHTLVTAFNAAVDENEYLMSVACAFAWDFARNETGVSTEYTPELDEAIREWGAAVAAAEKQNEEQK